MGNGWMKNGVKKPPSNDKFFLKIFLGSVWWRESVRKCKKMEEEEREDERKKKDEESRYPKCSCTCFQPKNNSIYLCQNREGQNTLSNSLSNIYCTINFKQKRGNC